MASGDSAVEGRRDPEPGPAPPKLATDLRALAAIAGVACIPAALCLAVLAAFIGVVPSSPNPYDGSGDPCCGTPDTWSAVRAGAWIGWLVLVVAAAVLSTGVVLLSRAASGRRLRWRWIWRTTGLAAVVSGALVVVTYRGLEDHPEVVECRAVVRDSSRATRPADFERIGRRAAEQACDRGSGLTPAQVLDELGER